MTTAWRRVHSRDTYQSRRLRRRGRLPACSLTPMDSTEDDDGDRRHTVRRPCYSRRTRRWQCGSFRRAARRVLRSCDGRRQDNVNGLPFSPAARGTQDKWRRRKCCRHTALLLLEGYSCGAERDNGVQDEDDRADGAQPTIALTANTVTPA
jgi:hypothetical protein